MFTPGLVLLFYPNLKTSPASLPAIRPASHRSIAHAHPGVITPSRFSSTFAGTVHAAAELSLLILHQERLKNNLQALQQF